MKAAVYKNYGPPEVLQLAELEKPTPKDNELLVKIHAATVTSGDVRLRSSDFPPLFWLPARLIFGLFNPKKTILGHELSGVVEAVGKDVTKFNVGDSVFGTTTMLKTGSYAEYVCLPEKWKSGVVEIKPENLSHQQAAALPVGAMTAIHLLEKAKLKEGQNVLIYGASGSVGSYAVQVVKNKSAKVTAVSSAANFDMVKSLGADSLIDYHTEDYAESNSTYDIVFDAVGKTSKSQAKKVLKPKGHYVSIKMITEEKDEYLTRIKAMAESGLLVPYIDQKFKLEDIVKAHKYVDTGRKRGNLVIDILE